MAQIITLKIVLEAPTAGVLFGLQEGKGHDYKTVQTQQSNGENLIFNCSCSVKIAEGKPVSFVGAFAQGKPGENFIYIDIGQLAGQRNTHWNRRLKIPLTGISPEMLQQLATNPQLILETNVAGKGKDGTPNCATVKPFHGWHIHSNS